MKAVFDTSMGLWYVLERAKFGRGHAEPGWDWAHEDYHHVSFETREEAEKWIADHQPVEDTATKTI